LDLLKMDRLVLVFLVLGLSGAPAATVLCDLVLCAPPANDVTGCHEHEPAGVGISATGDCAHLVSVAPFVSPAQRESARATTPAVVNAPLFQPERTVVAEQAAITHAPPLSRWPRTRLPLRI
jgi:hypothetical protein